MPVSVDWVPDDIQSRLPRPVENNVQPVILLEAFGDAGIVGCGDDVAGVRKALFERRTSTAVFGSLGLSGDEGEATVGVQNAVAEKSHSDVPGWFAIQSKQPITSR
jgi:hypothetical protein